MLLSWSRAVGSSIAHVVLLQAAIWRKNISLAFSSDPMEIFKLQSNFKYSLLKISYWNFSSLLDFLKKDENIFCSMRERGAADWMISLICIILNREWAAVLRKVFLLLEASQLWDMKGNITPHKSRVSVTISVKFSLMNSSYLPSLFMVHSFAIVRV